VKYNGIEIHAINAQVSCKKKNEIK